MPRKTYRSNKKQPKRAVDEEIVIKHTPTKNELLWQYTLKAGGQRYKGHLPTTQEVMQSVEDELMLPRNWRFYQVAVAGGDRAYTLCTSFPPFEPPLRIAEVIFPDGRIYESKTRTIKKLAQ